MVAWDGGDQGHGPKSNWRASHKAMTPQLQYMSELAIELAVIRKLIYALYWVEEKKNLPWKFIKKQTLTRVCGTLHIFECIISIICENQKTPTQAKI